MDNNRIINFSPFPTQREDFDLKNLDEQKVISLFTDVVEKMKRENQEINIKQAHIQVTWKSMRCFCSILQILQSKLNKKNGTFCFPPHQGTEE